jgi:hypothetical protein
MTVDLELRPQHVEQALGGNDRVVILLNVIQDNCKLIATDARHGVGFARPRAQAVGYLAKHYIAYSVTEIVVHQFESVQIDVEQRYTVTIAPRPGEALGQAIKEQSPVRQARKFVDKGHLLQLGLCFLLRLLPYTELTDHAVEAHDKLRDVLAALN